MLQRILRSSLVAAWYQYDPYGNVVGGSSSIYNPFQYASGWTSDTTAFTHFGQRWYAPQTNFTRWTQQDPIAGNIFQPTSQCRYAYASDDPVNLVDPSGSQTLSQVVGACLKGAFAGLATALLIPLLDAAFFSGVLTLPSAVVFALSGVLGCIFGVAALA